jgi:hypothetical protein
VGDGREMGEERGERDKYGNEEKRYARETKRERDTRERENRESSPHLAKEEGGRKKEE